MYKDKFVVAVKVGGKILREKGGVVYLPFGSEFSLLLKNLESRKSSVKISIDGIDVMSNRSLLISPNSSIELERFVESLDRGNKFKFIQKTKEIVEHRGDRVDDGIVRVEFAFEQMTKHINVVEYHDYHRYYNFWPYCPLPNYPHPWPYPIWTVTCSSGKGSSCDVSTTGSITNFVSQSSPLPEEGITVKGSESFQNFHEGYIGMLDPSEVIIIRLRGEKSTGVTIKKSITVKDKAQCDTCGNFVTPTVNFCGKCGTAVGG